MTYRVTSKGRNDIIDKVTSNTSVLLSGLDQLTRYKIKVQAQEKNGGSFLASAVVVLNTLGEFWSYFAHVQNFLYKITVYSERQTPKR